MSEPEVQPLVALVGRGSKVMLLLFLRHGVPFLFPIGIHTNVENLRANKHEHVIDADTNEDAIAAAIQRLVFIAIDLRLR